MTDAQKRQLVSDLYPVPKWKKRVARMSDDQVTAIYLRNTRDSKSRDIPPKGRGPHANEDDFQSY